MKKLLSVILGCSMFLSIAPVINASEYDADITRVNELISEGLTESEASTVLHYEKIKNELSNTGQVLDLNSNDQIVVTKDPESKVRSQEVGLPQEDLNFLQEDYEVKN